MAVGAEAGVRIYRCAGDLQGVLSGLMACEFDFLLGAIGLEGLGIGAVEPVRDDRIK